MWGSADWWPAGLGRPGAVGAQNDLRYAVFPETRRLVIDDQGAVTVYDTGSGGETALARFADQGGCGGVGGGVWHRPATGGPKLSA